MFEKTLSFGPGYKTLGFVEGSDRFYYSDGTKLYLSEL